MANNNKMPMSANTVGANCFKEAVCIEASRIFDSCSDKDCLEDLQVLFNMAGQAIIDQSVSVKCTNAEVVSVMSEVNPVPFKKGFFSVDMGYHFLLDFSVVIPATVTPINVQGTAYFEKKVILFGGDSSAKTFSSADPYMVNLGVGAPDAVIKVANPVILSTVVCDRLSSIDPYVQLPPELNDIFEGGVVHDPNCRQKFVLVTVGVFSIVTLQREVQIMIPTYDYSVPEKECTTDFTPENPCDLFKKVAFPVSDFFPDNLDNCI